MARTQIDGTNILDNSVELVDLANALTEQLGAFGQLFSESTNNLSASNSNKNSPVVHNTMVTPTLIAGAKMRLGISFGWSASENAKVINVEILQDGSVIRQLDIPIPNMKNGDTIPSELSIYYTPVSNTASTFEFRFKPERTAAVTLKYSVLESWRVA